ncbi:MAG TPA: UbiA-like polyprenyltransferase [Chondromyces sp.]|nr:UbiA-like polyprenyltransferase [Chondromyces sp.]
MEGLSAVASRAVGDLRETGEMIAFKHTVFALPFAVVALVTAAAPEWPSPSTWLWVGVAMVAARTAAMAFNRLVDHRIDAENPRTSGRALPAGRLGRGFAWAVTGLSAALLLVAAAALDPLCLALAPPALAVILGYSFAKRFTSAAHLWLGAALAIAPVGAWIAVTGTVAPPPLVLAAAVCLWVAGFDVIYSLQDEAFDRAHGLHSLPATLGGRRALQVARVFHGLAMLGFLAFAVVAGGGPYRLLAAAAAGLLLVRQHRLVSADDLRAVDAAFFATNGVLAVLMGALFVIARVAGT